MKSKNKLLRVLRFGLSFMIKSFPGAFITSGLVGVFYGTLYGLSTFVTQYFFDSVSDILSGGDSLNRAYVMIALLGATLISRAVISGVKSLLRRNMEQKANGALAEIAHKKMAQIDPVSLENTRLLDDINRSAEGATVIFPIVNTIMRMFTFFIPYFIVMGIYLSHLQPHFIVSLLLVFIPVFIAQMIRTGIIAKFEDIVAPIRREHGFYHQSFTARAYYKDTRLLGCAKYFAQEYLLRLNSLNKARVKVTWKQNVLELISGLLSTVGYVAILYLLVAALLNGEITVGAFAAVFSSIATMFGMMQEMIQVSIGQMADDLGKAFNFIRFLELPQQNSGEDGEPDYAKGISAKNVSFQYPNATQPSVSGVSLDIKRDETIAIVGENGAGKSTLVRLLIGLYAPTEGIVTINGMDTQKIKSATIFRNISGVFQRFQRYGMTLKDNVEISHQPINDNNSIPRSEDDVIAALEQANISIDGRSFPQALETMLSREFNWKKMPGVELSGGQWQRIAIARGLYRMHDIVVLDEPTASIDPLEESRIYSKFVEMSKDKTAIIITHRLGSTKVADRVVVMDKGAIIEEGSHNKLMQKQGVYTKMYNSQSYWYLEE